MLKSLLPPKNAKAPLIASFEAGEGKFRSRCHEIISLVTAKLQKFLCHHCANAMKASVTGAGAAAAITKETSHRIGRTGREVFTENVEV